MIQMTIKSRIENGVCYLILNRPEVFNSFNREMALEFQVLLDQCNNDNNIRAVVITGEGKAFCAGQDLAEVVDPEGPAMENIIREHYNPIIRKINALKKPVIAAVNGVAAGAGANIALACDIVFAKKSASFIQAFSKIGLIPDSGGTYILPRLIGIQKAMALMMTGEKVSAEEAERMNMIYKVLNDESFEEDISDFAIKISKMPTFGLALTKKVVYEGYGKDLNAQLELEEKYQTIAGNTEDFKEGVNAFLEKRTPNYKGY